MLEYEIENDVLRVYLNGEIDHHSSKVLRIETDDIISKCLPNTTILNFRKITFCDSSGIALVLGRYKLMNSLGGQLELESLPKQVENIFRLSGLNKIVKMEKVVK